MEIISLGTDCLFKTFMTELGYKKKRIDGEKTNPFDLAIHSYKSVLHFMPCKYKDFERVALMKMDPNAIQDWHTDGNRTTVLIYPLSDNYAPGETRNGKYHGPALVDVTKEHAVFNNDHTRINLQIGFNERIEKVWDLLQN